jgi:hypothetical protein
MNPLNPNRKRSRARAPRFRALASALLLAIGLGASAVVQAFPGFGSAAGGAGCDSLASEPVNYQVVFEDEIQPYFGGVLGSPITPRCETCHVALSFGNMSLAPINVLTNLLGVDGSGQQSPNYPLRRIVPGHPEQSLLFLRINCDDAPDTGGRMPPGSGGGMNDPEFLHFEALVHDWIKSGALMFGSDRVFQAGFDDLR